MLEQHKTEILGTKVNYYVAGKGNPLVFLHGHRGDALRWKGIILALAEKFKVYAPDFPGFGGSCELKEFHSMRNLAPYMSEFLEKLDLKEIVLFGGSMGGMVALHMLGKSESRIKKLVLWGPIYDASTMSVKGIRYLFFKTITFLIAKSKISQFIMKKVLGSDKIFYPLLRFFFKEGDKKDEIVWFEADQWRKQSPKIWGESLYDVLTTNSKDYKTVTSIPTIIAGSAADQYLDIRRNTEGLKKLVPNSEVIIVKGVKGHVPKGELTQEFVQNYREIWEKI